jgi:hypothetical protein
MWRIFLKFGGTSVKNRYNSNKNGDLFVPTELGTSPGQAGTKTRDK